LAQILGSAEENDNMLDTVTYQSWKSWALQSK